MVESIMLNMAVAILIHISYCQFTLVKHDVRGGCKPQGREQLSLVVLESWDCLDGANEHIETALLPCLSLSPLRALCQMESYGFVEVDDILIPPGVPLPELVDGLDPGRG